MLFIFFLRFAVDTFPCIACALTIGVLDTKSQNIPEVVISRRGAGGGLGIWEGWVNWGKGGANGVSLQATREGGGQFLSQPEGAK